MIEDLSEKLTERYGKGFSTTNLWYFRQFHLAYIDRIQIPYPPGGESDRENKLHPAGGESGTNVILHTSKRESGHGFSPQLSWSHYRALMRVKDEKALDFYEQEAIECGWSKTQLERQIHSAYYDRIIANQGEKGLLSKNRERLPGEPIGPTHLLKLKCFLLIDLKIGKLNHRDVGQMDGYVRFYEDQFKVPGDNPTIGLILCSDKSEAVAKYSVLSENRQIFASKYLQFLPSEEQLKIEIERERRVIEAAMAERRELGGDEDV